MLVWPRARVEVVNGAPLIWHPTSVRAKPSGGQTEALTTVASRD